MDMLHSSTDFDNVIENLTVLGLEKSWIESSSPVVFLENRELAQTLFEAKIDVSGAVALEPPFKQFAVAF
ncbi:hypothetical protein OFN49_31275, partial [Escherichia coli]|nr:hypothetical protein [Escherichia coli]